MEEIISWLNSEKDYFIGLTLLHRFSKNRQLLLTLTRRQMPDKLLYELKKLAPKSAPVQKSVIVPPEISLPEKEIIASDKLKIVRNNRTVALEELPIRLQNVYNETVILYKKMRALHERAKLIQNDNLREPVVKELAEFDERVRQNWIAIDSWDGQPDVPGGAIDHRRINANRKYITENRVKLNDMPKGADRDQLMVKMQLRINELLNAGETFGRIRQELINQGFKL